MSDERGMSLLEVVVATAVASLLMLGAATLVGAGLGPITSAGDRVKEVVDRYEIVQRQTRDARTSRTEP
jgi:prepilin-type N-terminal cleavage/methylation domain-containing protein